VAKDIHQIWTVFVSLLLFLSPVFYKLDVFKKALPAFDYANPIAGIIINARRVMMEHKPPSFGLLFADLAYAIILLLLGLSLLNRLGSKAAEKL
jgi:ABC-type polysaccharide/polyol phosphate export permease